MKYRIQFNDLTTDAYQKPVLSQFYSCWADVKTKSVSAPNADGEITYIQRLIFTVRTCNLLKEKLEFNNLSEIAIVFNNTTFKIVGADPITQVGYFLLTAENMLGN